MTQDHVIILQAIQDFLTKYPGYRFCQALQSLNVITTNYSMDLDRVILDDNFYDSDEELIKRIKDVERKVNPEENSRRIL